MARFTVSLFLLATISASALIGSEGSELQTLNITTSHQLEQFKNSWLPSTDIYNVKATASPNVFGQVKVVARYCPDRRAQEINFVDADANTITLHPQTRAVNAELFRGQVNGKRLSYLPDDYSSYTILLDAITAADLDHISQWLRRATINIEVVTWPNDEILSRFYAVQRSHDNLRMSRDLNYNYVAGNGKRPAGGKSFFSLRQTA